MLKVSARPKFKHKVTASVPVDGGYRDEEFLVTFRLASNADADLSSDTLKDDFLRDIVVELHDLADEDGKPIPYSDAVRDQVFDLPWARLSILTGYFIAVTGARAKN
jgi:hypothetical protein